MYINIYIYVVNDKINDYNSDNDNHHSRHSYKLIYL